jgi:hypothetical protein
VGFLRGKTRRRTLIPVDPADEPADFDATVRQRGAVFLASEPRPRKWKNKEFWLAALPNLYESYKRTCAYTAQWIPRIEGVATVDHFVPKSREPQLAYEWSNFRLTSLKMNSRKREHQDVLDPFQIKAGTFHLEFPSLIVKPNPDLPHDLKRKAASTIKRLKLNSDNNCITSRLEWLLPYCEGQTTFEELARRAPFIAYELDRQGKRNTISAIMKPVRRT